MFVGFNAKNHPQQVGKRGALTSVDDRTLPDADFQKLHEEFRFTVDVASSHENARLPKHYTIEDSGLEASWAGERVYCNPPYSDIRPWVQKAWDSSKWWRGTRSELVVMLLPANRTEQGWWQDLVEPLRGGAGFHVRFLRGRQRFIAPGKKAVGKNERPRFGCCLLVWE